ncbi:hypothetical protein LZZ85_27735 [Terrimonas sp. NA20]|uniref:Cysteine-rich CPCC domain-containing protein n=1 Tax=Terrimonas ginsenosidimutans TaxID=2908004 RepID=A0ABS9L0I9_9BACT|nr:CPCC family cysteine-rich protein [Terrimonas ginsenosidimutans]MCG2618126.1 hypothetical protein [Terrimonas ginsenosidimutans]
MRAIKISCFCCGYKTISDGETGLWEICPVCFWENDVTDGNIDKISGANKTSLREAQKNFQEFGACEKAMIKNVRSPKPCEERDTDWEPFD